MDLREKVEHAISSVIQIEQTFLQDDDGLIGYIVSPSFRGQDSYTRQETIYDALRAPAANLTAEDLRRVVAVVAFTPEEYAVRGPEMLGAH
ncbi:MAG: hypothetical protein WD872_01535 [Pirellulaceae bacterium]